MNSWGAVLGPCWSIPDIGGGFVVALVVFVTMFVRGLSLRVELSNERLLNCLVIASLSLSKLSSALANDSLDTDPSACSCCQYRNVGLPHFRQKSDFCCLV